MSPRHSHFDVTIQKANVWLRELAERIGCDRHRAYTALRATLHTLRDRLTVEEAVELGAQLPMLVRGLYYEGWTPLGKPLKMRRQDEFLAAVADRLRPNDDLDVELVVDSVLGLLSRHISPGELADVKHILPRAIRELWPEGAQEPGRA